MIEATIPVGSADELVMLLGASDQHLRRIRDSVPAKISARDGKIHVKNSYRKNRPSLGAPKG